MKQSIIAKYKDMSVPTKAALWFTGCSFFQKGISFITVPIFTRIMTSEQYGTYTVYLSWLQILTIFTSLYLFNGAFDNAMVKYQDKRDDYSSSMIGITVVLNLVLIGVFLVSSKLWVMGTGLDVPFIIFMFIESFVSSLLSFWSARQRFEYKYILLVVATIVKSVLNPVIGIVFVLSLNGSALNRIAGGTLVDCLVIAPLVIGQLRHSRKLFVGEYWKYALGMAVPAVPHYLSGTILNQGDRVMIDKMIGKSEVAYYGLAYSVGMLAQIFVTGITAAITPWMYSNMKKRDLKGMQGRLNYLCILIMTVIIGMIMISPELVKVFGTAEYENAKYVIPPIAGSVYFVFLYGIYSLPEFFYEKPKYLTIASLIAAVVNIGLNLIFIQLFGYIAAAYTTLACYMLYTLGHYIVGKRLLIANEITDGYVNGRLMLCLIFILIMTIALSTLLYKYSIVRYAVIGIGLISMFLLRNKIIPELKAILKR